jgi:hypothetical protein
MVTIPISLHLKLFAFAQFLFSHSSGHDELVDIPSNRERISKQSFATNWARFMLLVGEKLLVWRFDHYRLKLIEELCIEPLMVI